VRQPAEDRHAEADGLAGALADEPDAEGPLPDRLAGGALLVDLPEAEADQRNEAEETESTPTPPPTARPRKNASTM